LKQVLWLASWYPSSLDKFDGDFIQRHAKAVSVFCKVHLIHVKKDEQLKPDEIATEIHCNGNLTEEVIYYNTPKTNLKTLDKFLSQRKFNLVFRQAVNEYIKISGSPELSHVHVAMKAGIIALWIKRKWNIPFIVSEHWTGYLTEADNNLRSFPILYKKYLKKIFTKASALTTVSEYLGQNIKQQFNVREFEVISNVVDTEIFYPAKKGTTATVRFIHVSNMNYQKNVETILAALNLLKKEIVFEMFLYGPAGIDIMELIKDYQLHGYVFVMGEVDQTELAEAFRQSDALILYSRFETFGCVLIEANACGIPVIVSELDVFHEIVEEGVNGMFVEGENAVALAEKLKQFILQKNTFDKTGIAASAAEKYNYKKIGQQFLNLYNNIKKI
jgi:glycosyltransferase involved in cell wall biosynthesis